MSFSLNQTILAFSTTSFVFTRMQVLIWAANGTACLNVVEKDAGKMLSDLINDSKPEKPIVVSFKDIVNIDDHALDDVFLSLRDNKKQLIIVDGYHLVESIHKLKKDSTANIETKSEKNIIVIGNTRTIMLENLHIERNDAKDNFIKNTIIDTFREFGSERRLSSTPIIANGEFDSNIIISDPRKFIWVTAFLSDALRELLDRTRLNKVKLLSASLRAAPFAAMLGMLHNLEFEMIDHFGPKHKVFEFDFIKKIEKHTSYIYIGDYCFGGTEIKIAKAYTELKSSKLDHAIVIGNLIENDVFKSDFELISLARLSGICEKAKYKLLW